MEKVVYTPKEIQEILPIGLNKIYELLNSGKIESIRIGRKILIPSHSINKFLKEVIISRLWHHQYAFEHRRFAQ